MIAIFTHNNAYDSILLNDNNPTWMDVDTDIFKDFSNDLELDNWSGDKYWDEEGNTIQEAAKSFGEIIRLLHQ